MTDEQWDLIDNFLSDIDAIPGTPDGPRGDEWYSITAETRKALFALSEYAKKLEWDHNGR